MKRCWDGTRCDVPCDGIWVVSHGSRLLGPISSLFDVLTFAVLLALLGGEEAAFQTGWFVESLLTQVLVIFVIRTRGALWASRPHPLLSALSLGVAGLAILLPFTGAGAFLGMTPLPSTFYLFLAVAVPTYLAIVESAKRRLSWELVG